MRFLLDAQLPSALAALQRVRGHEAEHVVDVGPADASDGDVWRYALDADAVIITKDADSAELVATQQPAPVVVWARTGNVRRAALLVWFEPLIAQIVEAATAGEQLIELR